MKLTAQQIERFQNMEPFLHIDDIPDIPPVDDEKEYQTYIINNLIRCGAIPKKDLIVGKTYLGTCRNSYKATWNGKEFEYVRYKWGTHYDDTIPHFEDELHSDVFVPLSQIN